MRVYRFMSLANGLDSIQARRLRIGRLVELNDPYDCAPGIAHAPNISAGGEETFEAGYFAQFAEAFGLLSYSATVSDPVIWSHYADGHRGIALGFDYIDPDDGLIRSNRVRNVTFSIMRTWSKSEKRTLPRRCVTSSPSGSPRRHQVGATNKSIGSSSP